MTGKASKWENHETLFRDGSFITLQTPNSIVASGIGLTADKIVEGNTILDIEGTGGGSSSGTTLESIDIGEPTNIGYSIVGFQCNGTFTTSGKIVERFY
ncbi:MAG: hypothetical protein K2P14_10285 [Anaeroplasmataceae bacterium]|nr:hypothetical protein [Anaeroplasmataceae bacterium]